MTSRADVYRAIDSERAYQEMRVKRDQGQQFHSVADYLLFMEDYLTEARKIASRTWGPTADPLTLEVIRKVVALGVSCMEIHGAPQRAGFSIARPNDDATRYAFTDDGFTGSGERELTAHELGFRSNVNDPVAPGDEGRVED